MIQIQIDENTMIQADKYQFMICKRAKDKTLVEGFVWQPKEFFPRLEYLIDSLVEEKLFLSEATTFKQLLENQEKIKQDLITAIKKYEVYNT